MVPELRRSIRVLLVAVAIFRAVTARGVTINHYVSPSIGPSTNDITVGPDGNLWFTEVFVNKVGRITTAGVITEFSVPTPGSGPDSITAGPDGNLWFSERLGNQIGRMTTSGVVTEFTIPTPASGPHGITVGRDGNLWFTETLTQKIGRITPAGLIGEFSLTFGTEPLLITTGADGNLWFTAQHFTPGASIGRMTPAGISTEFPILNGSSTCFGIAAGPEGNIWFSGDAGIGRVTLTGAISEFSYSISSTFPNAGGIATGPDGNSWYTRLRFVSARVIPSLDELRRTASPTSSRLPLCHFSAVRALSRVRTATSGSRPATALASSCWIRSRLRSRPGGEHRSRRFPLHRLPCWRSVLGWPAGGPPGPDIRNTPLESIKGTYYTPSMARTVVSTKFQVVIPKDIREETGLRKGQTFQVISKGGVISLVPERPLSELKGFARNARSTAFREKRDRL